MIKKLKEYIVSKAHYPSFWNILNVAASVFNFKNLKQRLIKIKVENAFFKRLNIKTTVLRGPFAGMVYPRLEASYSEMAPKILGSYEAELFEPLQEIIKTDYKKIIDIGCAEGYYAVGLAMKIPNAEVFAYDINTKALRMCAEMAELNNVSSRISLRRECTSNTLQNFDLKFRSLIVCDCEGYEMNLFTKDSVSNLINCDLLIELHDILGLPVKETILPVFKATHNIKIIRSKARDNTLYSELAGINDVDRQIILSECRDGLFGTKHMEWAYITSKVMAM